MSCTFGIYRPRLEDGSEQVKRELGRIVGQLSCILSDSSQLSVSHTECTRLPELRCLRLTLAAEHGGKAVASLGASVVGPFLPLLRQQAPSSIKQGTLVGPVLQMNLDVIQKDFLPLNVIDLM